MSEASLFLFFMCILCFICLFFLITFVFFKHWVVRIFFLFCFMSQDQRRNKASACTVSRLHYPGCYGLWHFFLSLGAMCFTWLSKKKKRKTSLTSWKAAETAPSTVWILNLNRWILCWIPNSCLPWHQWQQLFLSKCISKAGSSIPPLPPSLLQWLLNRLLPNSVDQMHLFCLKETIAAFSLNLTLTSLSPKLTLWFPSYEQWMQLSSLLAVVLSCFLFPTIYSEAVLIILHSSSVLLTAFLSSCYLMQHCP